MWKGSMGAVQEGKKQWLDTIQGRRLRGDSGAVPSKVLGGLDEAAYITPNLKNI